MNTVAKFERLLNPDIREKLHSMITNLENDRRALRSFDTWPDTRRKGPIPSSVRTVAYNGGR
ncbi:MAG: hypothetical protein RIS36_1243 [Pseudomonadota bacterium]|jgi:hypothetical protein